MFSPIFEASENDFITKKAKSGNFMLKKILNCLDFSTEKCLNHKYFKFWRMIQSGFQR